MTAPAIAQDNYFVIPKMEWEGVLKQLAFLEKIQYQKVDIPDVFSLKAVELSHIFDFCYKSNRRYPNLAEERHFARYFLCKNTKLSLKSIALLTNCGDHSTVIHSRDKMKFDVGFYSDVRDRYKAFEQRIFTAIREAIKQGEHEQV